MLGCWFLFTIEPSIHKNRFGVVGFFLRINLLWPLFWSRVLDSLEASVWLTLFGRLVVDQDEVGAKSFAHLRHVGGCHGLACRLSMGRIPLLVILDFGPLLRSGLSCHSRTIAVP